MSRLMKQYMVMWMGLWSANLTCIVRANLLTNGNFEEPAFGNFGNNFPSQVPGWTLVPDTVPCESGHNIVVVGGTDSGFSYDGGPDSAVDGSRYYDICGAAGSISQPFTVTRAVLVGFGASFSRRDADSGGGNVAIYDAAGTTLIAASPRVTVAAGESQEIWRESSAPIANLPPGTYVFRIRLDDAANVDAAFVYPAVTSGGKFEIGDGTPGSLNERYFQWGISAAVGPLVLNGGNTPFAIRLFSQKNINRHLTIDGLNTAHISGQTFWRLFYVAPGGNLTLQNLTLEHGAAPSGAGILNAGTLSLNKVRIRNCIATSHGGAIQNTNILTAFESTFEYNRAGGNGGAVNTVTNAILSKCVINNNSAGARGGGFYSGLGLLQTGQCVFKWNTAGLYGGGLAMDGGTLRSGGDQFRGNRTDGSGGGMSLDGDCIVRDPVLTLNGAKGSGGAVDIPGGFNALLERPVIYSNSAADGALSMRGAGLTASLVRANFVHNGRISGQIFGAGGIRVTAGSLVISDSLLSHNFSWLDGGGVWTTSPDTVTLRNCTLSYNVSNQAVSAGGHMEMEDCRIGPAHSGAGIVAYGGTLTLSRTTISGDGTGAGTGVLVGSDASATMTNCTISGNPGGPGLKLEGERLGPAVTLTNVTIFGNGFGNVEVQGGGLRMRNSIIANPLSGDDFAGSGITSFGSNIVSDNSFVPTRPGDLSETDPLLGPFQSNGGPTPTHLPLSGSPAIDGVVGVQAPEMDQRGGTRPAGPAHDIGAVEANASGRINLAAPPAPTFDGYDRGDDDGDGVLDVDEFTMGTDPNSAASVLRLHPWPFAAGEFIFPSVQDRFYRLYVSPANLSAQGISWVDAGQGTIAGDGTFKSIVVAPTPGVKSRFYILKVMRTDGPWP